MDDLKSNRLAKGLILCSLLLCSFFVQAQNPKYKLVGQNDCGVNNAQPFLVRGENYTFPSEIKGSEKGQTVSFGSSLIYAFNDMDIQADYQLEVVYLADTDREQQIIADGNVIHGPVKLLKGKEERYIVDLPKKAFAYGQLVLVFEEISGAPNAVVSEINIYSSNPKQLKPFEGESKKELYHTQTYIVDTDVDVEAVMPTFTPIPSALTGAYETKLSLNGTWEFNPKPAADFYNSEAGKGWEPIVVPGQWSMQGFEVDSMQYAGYLKTFSVPRDWKGNNLKIRFDGVSSESEIYLNGIKVGSHLGGMTAFEVDVTSAVKIGQDNTLAVKVRSESLADMLGSLTQYAAHQLGGITRKVTVFAVPKTYIEDLRVETNLDKHFKDAELRVFAKLVNTTDQEQKNLSVRLTLDNSSFVIEQKIPSIPAHGEWTGYLSGTVKDPLKWDSEHPNLYLMKLDLSQNKEVKEQINKKIGFRDINVIGNQVFVNGKAIKLAGVCRHEVHPLTGRVLTADLQRKDVELYRAANVNFIRTSHYPPGEELLEICDELGMFVEVEAPVCWIGHHANENWKTLNYRDAQYYDYVLQANLETIHFYRNHPSVLFWSMANESYWNKEFAQVYEYVKKADTSRPSAFHDQAYGGFNNQGSTLPIANIHYPGPNGFKHAQTSNRPMVYGEYCHLNVYNRSEIVTDPGVRSDWALALQQSWTTMFDTPAVLGGSIWSGIDDVFQLPNGDAVGYGPWGPIDGWRRPKPEYWDMKKIYSPIRVNTDKLNPSNTLNVEVENRYTFSNLNEVRIDWNYGEESGVIYADIKPREKGTITININDPSQANELYISFTDPRGFVADEYVLPVGRQTQNELAELAKASTKLKTSKDKFVIAGKGFKAEISRKDGQITSMKKEGIEMIIGGPWLMALPLDGGGCYPNHNANTPLFNELCTDWNTSSVTAKQEGQDVIVVVEGAYKEFDGSYTITINANGEFTTAYNFKALGDVNPRQWGIVFDTPKSFDTNFWRRDALWSVYPDDHISRPTGEAKLFYEGLPDALNPRVEPTWAWSLDYNELGSSDFRSTRRDIWFAGLKDKKQDEVLVKSDGTQSWRSWLDKDRIKFLVADFVSPGFEMFLASYYEPYRKPIKTGDVIKGSVTVRLQNKQDK